MRRKEHRSAAIFADDLLRGCDDLYRVFGGEVLVLPISIPVAENGLVLLLPGGPLEAPRVPATMTVTRPDAPDCYGIRIERVDGGVMRIPGLDGGEPLAVLGFTITRRGLTIAADDALAGHDEDTARALANALFITIGMKLTKARLS